MSFFTHPYHLQQRRSAAQPFPFSAGPGHYGQHQYPFATPTSAHFFHGGNDYHPTYEVSSGAVLPTVTLDDEERAAIAHLRSIQRRKEAERIIREEAERERAIAQLQARREAAIAAKVRAHQEREREIALARARIERERELAIAQRMKEIESARRAEIESQQRRYQQQQFALIAARAQQDQLNEQRRQCARRCAARRAEQERQVSTENKSVSNDDGLEAFNRFIGSLFGIQLDTGVDSKPEAPAAPTPEIKKDEPVPAPAVALEQPATAPAPPGASTATEPAPATSKAAESDKKEAAFPDAINDVLANFLGLRVEPESKLGQAVSNKVPEGLNELLGQFGLEFFPDAPASEAKSAEAGPSESRKTDTPTTSAPASSAEPAERSLPRNPFDLSEFLKGENGLPPFVRDILGNVELAFKNEKEQEQKVEGKGKGVAEGEKKAPTVTAPTSGPSDTPAPVPTSTAVEEDLKSTASSVSIDKLESIASEVQLARDSFTFPSDLSFSHNAPTDNVPSLLFNKQNKPYHAQNNKLLQLLLQADGIASNGDRDVRRKRKEVVKLVEAELEGLEKKRDEIWKSVKERRENGSESSDDESSSWTTGSAVDHEEPEHVEDVAASVPKLEPSQATESAEDTPASAPPVENVEPATHEAESTPNTFADAVKSTEPETENRIDASAKSKADENSGPSSAKAEEEQGYELL